MATVEGDQPRVRPFGTAHIFEDKLYIQTGKSKPVSKQLAENAKCEICAFKDAVATFSSFTAEPEVHKF